MCMEAWRGHAELSPQKEDSVQTLEVRAVYQHCRAVHSVKWGIHVTLRWCVFSCVCVCVKKTKRESVCVCDEACRLAGVCCYSEPPWRLGVGDLLLTSGSESTIQLLRCNSSLCPCAFLFSHLPSKHLPFSSPFFFLFLPFLQCCNSSDREGLTCHS